MLGTFLDSSPANYGLSDLGPDEGVFSSMSEHYEHQNSTDRRTPGTTRRLGFVDFVLKECTFFRVHLFAFTFLPLIFSGIFYGCNGRFHISFLDALFLCYSAMTVTGLSTVNLSTTTAWQQIILYLLMMLVCIVSV